MLKRTFSPWACASSALLMLTLTACGPTPGGRKITTNPDATTSDTSAVFPDAEGDATPPPGDVAPPPVDGETPPPGACTTYCQQITETCTGPKAQFDSAAACESWCTESAGIPAGDPAAPAGNTVACRQDQVAKAAGDITAAPAHCDAAGPSGGNVCGTWCEVYCWLAQKNCTEGNVLYPDDATCLTACAGVPVNGQPLDQGGDSIQCRIYHVGAAHADPALHCPHGSVEGGGVCTGQCTPQCGDAMCGNDGCGGSCGECDFGSQCEAGQCQCQPSCVAKSCGDDGCGGSCGTCSDGESCENGQCEGGCVASCAGKECGDDGCGGDCGKCAPGSMCDPFGSCEGTCTPDCFAKDCGDDGCGGSCGACDFGLFCSGGQCLSECTPDCFGQDCGDDGCGGSCGTCFFGETCQAGSCVDDCAADCLGKDCGDDGCGGSCGACGFGETCQAGLCEEAPPAGKGDTCDDPFVVGAVPFSASGNTEDATPNYATATGVCPGESTAWGGGSNDEAWYFVPEASGEYTISLTAQYDSLLFVVEDCGAVDSTCLGADEIACSDCTEQVVVSLTAGKGVYVIVDGYSNSGNQSGEYVLEISSPGGCVASCAGKECGDDGCGGSCGTCGEGTECQSGLCDCVAVCDGVECGDNGCGGSCGSCEGGESCIAGACIGGGPTDGDTCASAIPITSVPFTHAGTTVEAGSDYGYGAGACPGESTGWGAGSPDLVYVFTAAATGEYTASLTTSSFDSTLYAATDCGNINGSCLGGDDDICSSCTESITFSLTAGTTVWVFVDGYSNSGGTSGSYSLTFDGEAGPPPVDGGKLVLNEIDYDNPGSDNAEFVELLNAGDEPMPLTGLTLETINGLSGAAYGSPIALTDAGTMSLAPGGRLVIGTAAALALVPAGVPTISASSGWLQNGGPEGDGVRIMSGATILDAVSYEAVVPLAAEGANAGTDAGEGSLSRCPDGGDTNDNGADFTLTTTLTPGSANSCP